MKLSIAFLVPLCIYHWSNMRTLAFLYTDPGSGALLWQLMLAAIFGALFYARLFIRRVTEMFRKERGKQNERQAPTTPNQDGLR
jgi:hypothetical protein